jgi:hypothetical protein
MMAKLSDEEKAQLKALQDKSEAPDEPAAGRMTNITIDLSDPAAVKRAVKLGLLNAFTEDDEADDDEVDDDEPDEEPERPGFFGKRG